jgi:hypothetical protein
MTGTHAVSGVGNAGTAVTLTGSAAFTSATTYACYGSDNASTAVNVVFTYATGTAFTPNDSSPGDAVRYMCIGN